LPKETANTTPQVLVLRTAGTNCDRETAFAFQASGANVDLAHINELFAGAARLKNYHILAIPGGFTYGDDIMSGRILANELRLRLGEDLHRFIQEKKLIIGICNGFQVLVRAGILPGPASWTEPWYDRSGQTATLVHNDSGRFEARWIYLKREAPSVWTSGLDEILRLPIAHGEGKFVPGDKGLWEQMKTNGQIAFRYCDREGQGGAYPVNPNGSFDDIAGITDPTGRILGLMPHPERHFVGYQRPDWTRQKSSQVYGQGARIFANGVNYVKEKLLS
jgi:phosphoribosylformylglycinamidine synthase